MSGQGQRFIDEILSGQYEFKMISSGNNFPNFNTEKDFLREILVLLHQGIASNEIQKYFKWDDKTFSTKIGILKNANFIKSGNNGSLHPNVFVCSINDGLEINKQLYSIVKQTADSIQKRSKVVEQEVKKNEALKAYKFEEVSLLILSDVLLDNWQINNVENEFLKSSRTQRHGKNYYVSFQEKQKGTNLEAFGIFGTRWKMLVRLLFADTGT